MLVENVKIGIFKSSLKFESKNMRNGKKIGTILNYIIILTNHIKGNILYLCNFTSDIKRQTVALKHQNNTNFKILLL